MKTSFKTLHWIYLVLVLFVSINFAFKQADENTKPRVYKLPKGVTSKDYLPNVLVIKYKNVFAKTLQTSSVDASLKKSNLTITYQKPLIKSSDLNVLNVGDQQKIESNGINRIFETGFESNLPIEKVIDELLEDETIEYVEPSFIYRTFAEPNDTDYLGGHQSYLKQIKAEQAWGLQSNSNGVIIAIVDGGADLNHTDLADNIYINKADPVNGIDDDNDGYIDNNKGWDFVGASSAKLKEDNNPGVNSDSIVHGTHVSGLASAVSNNSTGITSIAQNAKLMIIKVGSDDNAKEIYRGYDGIIYAANRGAKIINCSWGGTYNSAYGQDVINYAVSKGCLVIAAAGNSGSEEKIYPAAYKGVLAVGNVLSNDVKHGSSSYGYHVGIYAPGKGVYSTLNNNGYGFKSGTSMATPIVSSAAALVLAKTPSLNGQQVGELLRLTADPIDAVVGNEEFKNKLGGGRLNVFKALSVSNLPAIRYQKFTINDNSAGALAVGDTISIYLDLKNILQATNILTVSLKTNNQYVKVINGTFNTGSFASAETKKVGPFKVLVREGISIKADVVFELNYNSSNYQDKEFFTAIVNLDYQNVTVNQVQTTATSNGRIGYGNCEKGEGLGFVYKGNEMLHEAGLMIGTSSTSVSNSVRGIDGQIDEHFKKIHCFTKVNGSKDNYEGYSLFSDYGNANKLNIDVRNRIIANSNDPHDKYIIVEYEIFNKNTVALENLHVSLFTDWDIFDGTKNIVKYDANLKMGYTYSSSPASPFAGVKLLSNNANPVFHPFASSVEGDFLNDGNFTIAEKFASMSQGITTTSLGSGNGLDVMNVIGYGPFSLQPSASVKVAFAFIAGDNLADISKSATIAQTKYSQTTVTQNFINDLSVFEVSQNYPNPVKDKTSIEVKIPESGKAGVEVYDLTGRKVLQSVSQEVNKGTHVFELNTAELYSGIYFYKTTFNGQEKTMKMLVQK